MGAFRVRTRAATYFLVLISFCRAWLSHPTRPCSRHGPYHRRFGSVASLGMDEAEWEKEGERIIMNAAVAAGAKPEMIHVGWKPGRVVVTVDGSAYIPAELDFGLEEDDDLSFVDDDEEEEDDFDEMDDEEEDKFDGVDGTIGLDEEEFNLEMLGEDGESLGVDVVSLARAINWALEQEGEGSIGYNIAVHHAIEVTTPGISDALSGVMFEAYRGFDVILEYQDAKTGKSKKVEGRLVDRDKEFTRVNEKGRIRKFKNDIVLCVKLPKAKSEKGSAAKSKKKSS